MLGRVFSTVVLMVLVGGVFKNAAGASENGVYPVHSSFTTRLVYEVVSGEGLSEGQTLSREPGIYAEGQRNRSQLLLPGAITGVGKYFDGVLEQFKTHYFSQRHEIAVLLNGQLTFLSTKTRPNRPATFISVGSAQAPLMDIQGNIFRINPITDPTHVQVVGSDLINSSGVVVLASVKQSNSYGDGLTFAAFLPTSGASDEIQFLRPPRIINYSFLNKGQLQTLLRGGNQHPYVLSQNHLQLLGQPTSRDDRVLTEWRRQILKWANPTQLDRELRRQRGRQANTTKKPAAPTDTNQIENQIVFDPQTDLPFYDVEQGSLRLSRTPAYTLTRDPFALVQVSDPFGAQSGIMVEEAQRTLSTVNGTTPLLMGTIDYDARKRRYAIKSYGNGRLNRNGMIPAVVGFVSGRPYLFYRNNDSAGARSYAVPLGSAIPADAREFTFNLTQIVEDEKPRIFLVFSVKESTGKQYTSSLEIVQQNGMAAVKGSPYKLTARFYDAKELDLRTMAAQDVSVRDVMVFDPVSSLEHMQKPGNSQRPQNTYYVDLGKTNLAAVRSPIIYLRNLESTDLSTLTSFIRVDATRAQEDRTGIYMREQLKGPLDDIPVAYGQLLKINPNRADSHLEYIQLNHRDSRLSDVSVKLLAMADAEEKKNKKFRISALISSRNSEGQTVKKDFLVERPVAMDFSSLVGVQMIRGRRNRSSEIYVLLFFADARESSQDRSRKARGGIAVLTLDVAPVQRSSDPKDVVATANLNWLIREPQNPILTVRQNLIFDAEGRLFYKVSPSLHHSHQNFAVKPLRNDGNAESIYINRGSDYISLRPQESLEEASESISQLMSSWVIYSRSKLFERHKGLDKFVEERREKQKSRKLQREDAAYDELYAYLESLANHESPRTHQVVLVSEKQKATYQNQILGRLTLNPNGIFSLEGPNSRFFNFAEFDATAMGPELIREFKKVRQANGSERTLLYTDMESVIKRHGWEKVKGYSEEGEGSEEGETGAEENTEGAEGSTQEGAIAEAGAREDENDYHAPEELTAEMIEERENKKYPTYSLVAALAAEGNKIALEHIPAYARENSQIPMLILATPREWRTALKANPHEVRQGVFDSFQINRNFLTSTWTVFPPGSESPTPRMVQVARKPIAKEDFSVFPNLEPLLEGAADKDQEPEHMMIIVPQELKALVLSLIDTRWATEARQFQGRWSHKNRQMMLFRPTEGDNRSTVSQEEIFDNYEAVTGVSSSKKPVVLTELSDVIRFGRPGESDSENAFLIRDPASMQAGSALEAATEQGGLEEPDHEAQESNRRRVPHFLWWLAAEGKRVQPEAGADWSLKEAAGRKVSTIVVATEEEMSSLDAELDFESRFFDYKKHFKQVRLTVPTDEVKVRLILEMMSRSEISGIGYQFTNDHGQTGNEARRQLVEGFVSRVNQIARQNKIEPTTAFIRAFAELRRSLVFDTNWRSQRNLTRSHFDRMFNGIFNIPLNPRSLDPGHWLLKFEDPDRAALGITEVGYPGPMELKRRMAVRQWAVTRGMSEAEPIPNYVIAIGPTSTGKTRLFRKTYEYAGLKTYDPKKHNDENPGFWVIPVGTLTKEDGKGESTSSMSIAEADKHILNLLAMNPMAQIVFDDVHKAANKDILAWVIGWLNRLTEAEKGMITVNRYNDSANPREIPVRLIGLGVTINPNEDQTIVKKFSKDGQTDLDSLLTAAIQRFPDYKPDPSLFARVPEKIDMSQFPMEARVPAVVINLRKSLEAEYNADSRLRLILPEVLQDLTSVFAGAHARELIQAVTQRLVDLPRDIENAPLYIQALRDRRPTFDPDTIRRLSEEPQDQQGDAPRGAPNTLGAASLQHGRENRLRDRDVEKYLSRQTEVVAVRRERPETLVDFIAYVMNGYRIHVYASVLRAGGANVRLMRDSNYRERLLPQLVASSVHAIEHLPFLPIRRTDLRPEHFGRLTAAEEQRVRSRIETLSFADREIFPVDFRAERESDVDFEAMLGVRPRTPSQRTRLILMSETAAKIAEEMALAFNAYFRTDFTRTLPDPVSYIRGLPEGDPKESFEAFGHRMVELYGQFTHEIRLTSLLPEDRQEISPIHNYQAARLFLMAVDRAITQMPWGPAGEFLFRVVEVANRDQALSSRAEFQSLLFESLLSPLSPVTPDVVTQAAQTTGAVRHIDNQQADRDLFGFQWRCESMLLGGPR